MNYSQVFGPGAVVDSSVHLQDFFDILPYLTGDLPMDQEGTNGEPSMYTVPSGPRIGYDHSMGSNEVMDGSLIPMPDVAGAPYLLNSSPGAQYLVQPSAGADHHVVYGVPGRCLYETFDDGSNAGYLAPALPPINTHFPNVGHIFPSPNTATTDTSFYTNTTESHPSELPLQLPQAVGSDAMRTVSNRRRKKDPIIRCEFQDCNATFTTKHNYNCPYFFTGNILSN